MTAVATPAPFAPIMLTTIDVERGPERIDDGAGHGAVWALVREGGRPRGTIRLGFVDGRVSAEQLSAAIAALPDGAPTPPAPETPDATLPSVSVVIPCTFARPDGLEACLRALQQSEHRDYEVIVVDNRPAGSAPVTLPGVRVVRQTRPGIAAARNRGLAHASGEIIAFTDDDVAVDPGWLTSLARRFASRAQEACVTGLTVPSELRTPAQLAFEDYYGGYGGLGLRSFEAVSYRLRHGRGPAHPLRPATVDAIGEDGDMRASFSLYATGHLGHGANMAFRAHVLHELGGFDEALGTGTPTCGGEDLAMFARVIWGGHAIGFEPAALVHHRHRPEADALRRQVNGYGIGWTATMLSLILDEPRHIGSMLASVPSGGRDLAGLFRERFTGAPADSPTTDTLISEMARLELLGMAKGPLRYVRSRLTHRR